MEKNTNAIGIFDSGVGGLTVCKSLKDIMPAENLIYFGDTARFPYGTRSKETIIRYSREIVSYLVSRNVKMVVIACNTSSAVALDVLKEEFEVPIVGVIKAGARAACRIQTNGIIGVIGTRATVNSRSYEKAICEIDPTIQVYQQHATIFVALTEEGWVDDEITRLAAKKYISEMYNKNVRTLILGCTHFPLLKKAILDVFPDLVLVDSGYEVALEVQQMLKEKNLENSGNMGKVELYASDITDTLQMLKNMFFGENGASINKLTLSGGKL
ncbi:MAG: glutamate racemase [Spirochaetes bacterium]|nr:glutamate racemase [Spirochaetota bacterium]